MTEHVVAVPVATVWTGPDAPREVDAPAVADAPDAAAFAALSDHDRTGLHGRILTQALLGEPVRVVAEHGAWYEVVLPWQPGHRSDDGYPGWVRRAHVLTAAPVPTTQTVAVTALTARCTPDAGEPLDLSYGTLLPLVAQEADHHVVELPDGRVARVPLTSAHRTGAPADAELVLASARQLVGLRYLWGGTSGWGVDCSGFVHLVHRAHGVVVPRDACDQQLAGQPSTLDAAVPGELYFFARPDERAYHVGFVTSTPEQRRAGGVTMLHAPEGVPGDGGLVEDSALAPHRLTTLVGAGGFLGSS